MRQADLTLAHASEPGLFKKYSTFQTYKTSRAVYPWIRVFYKEHYEASKLPADLPLLVCCITKSIETTRN